MKDYLISMFVDNELDLDDKIEFVETVHSDKGFKNETVEMLDQEKLLHADLVTTLPDMSIPRERRTKPGFSRLWFPPLAGFATAMALVAALFLLRPASVISNEEMRRFVIYRPDANQAEIVGTFTNWSPMALKKIGTSGYWSISLKLPEGEHRYSYLVDNGRQLADPTVLTREQDDFGGENSIIKIAVAI